MWDCLGQPHVFYAPCPLCFTQGFFFPLPAFTPVKIPLPEEVPVVLVHFPLATEDLPVTCLCPVSPSISPFTTSHTDTQTLLVLNWKCDLWASLYQEVLSRCGSRCTRRWLLGKAGQGWIYSHFGLIPTHLLLAVQLPVMCLGAVMSWISNDHDSSSAEPIWASCTCFGNQTVGSSTLHWSRAAPLDKES